MPATLRSASAYSPSPAPSDMSDMYYSDLPTPTPGPDQTWDDLLGPASADTMDIADATPTPATPCGASPASVVEITAEEFPALAPSTAAAAPKAASKAKKGKGKAKATRKMALEDVTEDSEADNDPFLAADIAAAKAASLGLQTVLDNATPGASSSSSRVPPPSGPASPPKRARSNSAGDVTPTRSYANAASSGPSPFLVPVTVETPATPTSTAPTPQSTVAAAAQASTIAAPAALTIPPAIAHAAPAVAAPATIHAPAPVHAAPAAVLAQVPVVPAPVPPAAAAPAPLMPAAVAAQPPIAIAPAAAAMWATYDGLPSRGSFTLAPPGGFPGIVYSRDLLFQGMPANLQALHDDVPHPKFYVVVSGGNGAVVRTHGLICKALGNYINFDTTAIQLGTPPTPESGPSPIVWLVAGIPTPLTQVILGRPAISSRAITLYPVPYDVPIVGYVGTFAGFTLPATQDGANTACNLIVTAVRADTDIAQYVQTHRDASGPHISAVQAWDAFTASIYVHSIDLTVNGTTVVAWQLYVTPPTNDRVAWAQICRLFGRINVMTALHGTARLQRGYRCRICPSIAHPTGLCPFPNIPGWLGPTPTTIAALEDASRQAAAKAQELMRSASAAGPGNANTARSGPGRNQGPTNGAKPRKDGKGKKGGDAKGKGKRREFDDFL
ncbi:hypothetical protein C8R45DRAFT_1105523 [Mycena sanguinolenta]|nr:hypothetical protein C8R45DRAFT_1105523 [Mycena sanguinolenta]